MIRSFILKLLASFYIFVILDRILCLLFISYASLLVVLIKFIELHYAGFYNISKVPLLLESVGADLIWFSMRIITNTVSKVMLVAQRKMTFLPSRIQIMLAIPPIENPIEEQSFLFKEEQFHRRV